MNVSNYKLIYKKCIDFKDDEYYQKIYTARFLLSKFGEEKNTRGLNYMKIHHYCDKTFCESNK